MKHFIILAIFLFTGLSSNNLFAQNKTLLTITVLESFVSGYNKIIVLENDKKIEEIEMLPFHYKDLDSPLIAINKTIMKYNGLGYEIVSEIRGSITNVMVTTYRLEKKSE